MSGTGDATTKVWATQRNADLFKQVFKREVSIQAHPLKAAEAASQPIGLEEAPTAEPLWARAQEITQRLKTRP